MQLVFPSESWISAYRQELEESVTFRKAAAAWTHGAVALVCYPARTLGLADGSAIWLDLWEGTCREARACTPAEARHAAFCISADYHTWKRVIRKELNPVFAIVRRKLRVRGNLATVLRFVKATQELAECASRIPSRFLDE